MSTVEPRCMKVFETMKNTLLYRAYIIESGLKDSNMAALYMYVEGFCYIRPLYTSFHCRRLFKKTLDYNVLLSLLLFFMIEQLMFFMLFGNQ